MAAFKVINMEVSDQCLVEEEEAAVLAAEAATLTPIWSPDP